MHVHILGTRSSSTSSLQLHSPISILQSVHGSCILHSAPSTPSFTALAVQLADSSPPQGLAPKGGNVKQWPLSFFKIAPQPLEGLHHHTSTSKHSPHSYYEPRLFLFSRTCIDGVTTVYTHSRSSRTFLSPIPRCPLSPESQRPCALHCNDAFAVMTLPSVTPADSSLRSESALPPHSFVRAKPPQLPLCHPDIRPYEHTTSKSLILLIRIPLSPTHSTLHTSLR